MKIFGVIFIALIATNFALCSNTPTANTILSRLSYFENILNEVHGVIKEKGLDKKTDIIDQVKNVIEKHSAALTAHINDKVEHKEGLGEIQNDIQKQAVIAQNALRESFPLVKHLEWPKEPGFIEKLSNLDADLRHLQSHSNL